MQLSIFESHIPISRRLVLLNPSIKIEHIHCLPKILYTCKLSGELPAVPSQAPCYLGPGLICTDCNGKHLSSTQVAAFYTLLPIAAHYLTASPASALWYTQQQQPHELASVFTATSSSIASSPQPVFARYLVLLLDLRALGNALSDLLPSLCFRRLFSEPGLVSLLPSAIAQSSLLASSLTSD